MVLNSIPRLLDTSSIVCVSITFVFVATEFFCFGSASAADLPNVLVIVADDLGYADMSFLDSSPADIQTPAIDSLAARGTYFSNAYATAPICSPSRCGLITGRYQQRWGNYWYGQGGLPKSQTTIPQALKKLGYSTKKIGKTHLNGGEAQHPLDHGFDEFIGFIHHTWDYIRLNQADLDAYEQRAGGKSLGILCVGPLQRNRGESASYDDGFTTEIFTDEAIKTIESAKNSHAPFFVELEYNAVHMPTYIAHPDYAIKAGYLQQPWDPKKHHWEFPFWDPRDMSWDKWHKKWGHLGEVDPIGRKRYLANLMALDDGIGRILKSLDDTNQAKETILVFLSDNGGTINTYSNNTPLRGYKYMFGEGGVRIPMIVSWPDKLPQGERRDALASGMDVFPTILELIGATVPKNLDGKSLVDSINTSNAVGHDHLCFADGKGTWSIRQGDWKLIHNKEAWVHSNYKLNADNVASSDRDYVYPSGTSLFNLAENIGETKNVADQHPDRVVAMEALYRQWREKMGEPRSGKVKQGATIRKNEAKK